MPHSFPTRRSSALLAAPVSTPFTYSVAVVPSHTPTTWLHASSVAVPPVRSHPTWLPLPLYMRQFQPVAALRWKKAQPERLPAVTRLKRGQSSLSEASGLAQNSTVNGLPVAGLSPACHGIVVCAPAPL